jgi:hypothetical protein
VTWNLFDLADLLRLHTAAVVAVRDVVAVLAELREHRDAVPISVRRVLVVGLHDRDAVAEVAGVAPARRVDRAAVDVDLVVAAVAFTDGPPAALEVSGPRVALGVSVLAIGLDVVPGQPDVQVERLVRHRRDEIELVETALPYIALSMLASTTTCAVGSAGRGRGPAVGEGDGVERRRLS